MELRRVGEQALLLLCDDAAGVPATYAAVRELAAGWGASEVVPAARTVLIDGLTDVAAAEELLQSWEPPPAVERARGPLIEIETRYDGPDLDEVARQWQLSAAEVVAAHQATEFVVVFCGFAPGFAYCTGLAEGLVVRRRADPRPSVPAGSVGLAGEYTGVYPTSSPGGWQLIGRTDVRLWRPELDRPALLAPGTRIRFVDA